MTDSTPGEANSPSRPLSSQNHKEATRKKTPPEPSPSPFPPETWPEVVDIYRSLEELLDILLYASGRKSWGPPYAYIGKDPDWSRENRKRCLTLAIAFFLAGEALYNLELDREGKRKLVTPPAVLYRRHLDELQKGAKS